ncbi:hypothetical protein FV223_21805 [Methylobacterium sp. WL116]|nr:hypothetical protein FV223_21805 [Methylobacterium sp. WL116]
MAPPHYVVRRSRSGRFNFALITDYGRITGYVSTDLDGRSSAELEREARDKIGALAGSFAEVAVPTLDVEAERTVRSAYPSGEFAT